MLAISPLRSIQDGSTREGGTTTTMDTDFHDEFPDFSGVNLLESIDFDDLFMGLHSMDGLPDLEMDPELLAEFSISGEEDSSTMSADNNIVSPNNSFFNGPCEDDLKLENCDTISCLMSKDMLEENEIESKKKDSKPGSITTLTSSSCMDKDRGNSKKHKSSLNTKREATNNNNNHSNQGKRKRKTKVDWTPELHRRFVQAVEQLGVDKAVPSRILEVMGIDCLTRHNIASHLQKYRSHRKHLLAREAEAATWTQKRQMYGVAMGSTPKSPWPHPPPIIGFPPMTTTMHHPVRPFHVWGHPSMDSQARMSMWPKNVGPRTLSHIPQPWAPHPPPSDSAFWHFSHHRVAPSQVPGIPPHAMYGREHGTPPPPTTQSSGSATPLDPQPSKESVDAALGDVLAKPWLPLPIGLKPPSMDSVFVELQRQGISKIPPSSSS